MVKADKTLIKMQNNPRDWSIENPIYVKKLVELIESVMGEEI